MESIFFYFHLIFAEKNTKRMNYSKSSKIVRLHIEILKKWPKKADFVFLTLFSCSPINFEQEKKCDKPNNHTLKNDKNWLGWDKTVNGCSKCVLAPRKSHQ